MLEHKTNSSSTQTKISTCDAMSQTISSVHGSMLMLDAAVQTICETEEFDAVPKVKIKLESEMENKLSSVENANKMRQLLEAAMQDRVGNEYPCQLCQAKFTNLYGVKTHILETHENFGVINAPLRESSPLSDSSTTETFKSQSDIKGSENRGSLFKLGKNLKKKKKKLSNKKKPWCNFCWIKFKDVKQYQRHRQILHPELVKSAIQEISEDVKVKDENISEEDNSGKKSPRKDPVTSAHVHIINTVKPSGPVNVIARVEEGFEIRDIPNTRSHVLSKIQTLRYENPGKFKKLERRRNMRIHKANISAHETVSDEINASIDDLVSKSPIILEGVEENIVMKDELKLDNEGRSEPDEKTDMNIDSDLFDSLDSVLMSSDNETSDTEIMEPAKKKFKEDIKTKRIVLEKELEVNEIMEPAKKKFKEDIKTKRIVLEKELEVNEIKDEETSNEKFIKKEEMSNNQEDIPEGTINIPPVNIDPQHKKDVNDQAKIVVVENVKSEFKDKLEHILQEDEHDTEFSCTLIPKSEISPRSRPIRKKTDWETKKKDWISKCPLPIKELKVILKEKVEEAKEINIYGKYYMTELDHLETTVEEFHKEMDAIIASSSEEPEIDPEELEKLPWYEVRYHECLICKTNYPLGSMNNHVNKVHNISIEAYREKFPADDFSVQNWTCRICLKEVKWTAAGIRGHLRNVHRINTEDYLGAIMSLKKEQASQKEETGGAPWYESKQHKCRICDSVLSVSQIYEHLRTKHFCTYADYKQIFPDLDMAMPLWKCLICKAKVSWARRPIQQHLGHKHTMSIQSYEEKYMAEIKQECCDEKTDELIALPAKMECDNDDVKSSMEKAKTDSIDIQESQEKVQSSEISKRPKLEILKPVQLESREREPSSIADLNNGTGKKVWLPWYESKLHTCMMCGELRVLGLNFKNHLYSSHDFLSRKEYKQRFPEADIEPMSWQCHICNSSVLWTKKCIVDHLTSNHMLTLKEFEDTYKIKLKHAVDAPHNAPYNRKVIKDINVEPPPVGPKTSILNNLLVKNVTSTSSQKDLSNKSDAICSLCSQSVDNFTEHVTDYHKLQKNDYLKIFPSDEDKFEKPLTTWSCKICSTTTNNDEEIIKSHLEMHAINVEDYGRTFEQGGESSTLDDNPEEMELPEGDEMINETNIKKEVDPDRPETPLEPPQLAVAHRYGKPWYEVKKTTCGMCNKTFWHGQFIKHIKLEHALPLKDYKMKFPEADLEIDQYRCLVCGAMMAHYSSPISGHLTSKHGITITEYYEKYQRPEELNPKPKEEPLPPVISTVKTISKSTFDIKSIVRQVMGSSDQGDGAGRILANKNYKETGQYPWYECKTVTCELCKGEYLMGSFRRHLYDQHDKMSRTTYQEKYPDADMQLPNWVCKVCNSGIKWVRDNIFNHLKVHNISMDEYYNKFIKSTPSPDVQKVENPAATPQKVNLLSSPPMLKPMPTMVPLAESLQVNDPNPLSTSQPRFVSGEEKKFRCKICNQLVNFNSEAIKTHLFDFHNMTMNEYPKLNPPSVGQVVQVSNIQPGTIFSAVSIPNVIGAHPVPISQSSITICRTQNPAQQRPSFPPLYQTIYHQTNPVPRPPPPPPLQNMAFMKPPMVLSQELEHQSNIDLQGAPWYNKCKWTCLLCNKTFCSGFWRHVNEKHFLKKEDYLRDYGKQGIEIVHYFCKICNKKIPWSGASINAHMKTAHCMTLREYESVYGQPRAHPASQFIGYRPIAPAPHPKPLATKAPSDKWFNGCEYSCQLCARVLYSVAGLSMHLKEAHNMEKFDYFKQFGRNGIKIRKYKCKICGKNFPWSGVSISKHVKQAHDISLPEYTARFEKESNMTTTRNSVNSVHDGFTESILKKNFPDNDGFHSTSKKDPNITGYAKDKWYNKCSWTCQICGKLYMTNSSAFFKHVTQDHKVSVEDYKEKYGNTGIVFVDHKCKLCKKLVPCNGLSMCKHYKHTHNMGLEEYEALYMVGDDGSSTGDFYEPTDEYWYNKCIWKCNICGNKNRSLGSSKKHVHKMHNISYEDYLAQYGNQGIFECDFTCTICQAVMSCNGVTISSHLSNIHKLTLQEYENKYVKEKINIENKESKDNLDLDDKSTINLLTPITEMEGGVGAVELKIKEEKMDPPSPSPAIKVRNPFQDVTKEDRPWYQQCLYVCQICQSTYYSTSALNNHTKVKHNMERDAYLSQFGDKGKLIEDYSCKICNRVMKCEGKALGSHMKNVHKMSIEEYTRLHEPDRNTEHDPNFYNESYQIEIDQELEEEEIDNIGIDPEDPLVNDTGKESGFDPLADIEIGNVVSGENFDFSFEDEESLASEDLVEGFEIPQPEIHTRNDAEQKGEVTSTEKSSINTQTIKNIVSKTLFTSVSREQNSLNNNSDSLTTPPPMTSSSPVHDPKENQIDQTEGSPVLPETCHIKEKDTSLPTNESHSIISLEMLDRNDDSFTTDQDDPPDQIELPYEEGSQSEEVSESQAQGLTSEGIGPTTSFSEADSEAPMSAHELYMSEMGTVGANEEGAPLDDFPEIDFSSVNMGVLELDNEDETLLLG